MTASGDPPPWLRCLVEAARSLRPEQLSRTVPPGGGRESAVLVLFGEGPRGPDVLLTERSRELRRHAGQAAFPGGALDPGDEDPVAAALREAVEETGLDPSGVDVLASLPALWVPPSGYLVVPVVAWWRVPCAVRAVDPHEVAAVVRAPLAGLSDPANRFRVRHPSGATGPAFDVDGLLVWGFTAGLLDWLLAAGGIAGPWDETVVRELPPDALRLALRGRREPV